MMKILEMWDFNFPYWSETLKTGFLSSKLIWEAISSVLFSCTETVAVGLSAFALEKIAMMLLLLYKFL